MAKFECLNLNGKIWAAKFEHIKYASKTLNANSLWQKIWSVWPQKTKQCKVLKKNKKIARLVVVVVAVEVVFIHWILSKDTFIMIQYWMRIWKQDYGSRTHNCLYGSCLSGRVIKNV